MQYINSLPQYKQIQELFKILVENSKEVLTGCMCECIATQGCKEPLHWTAKWQWKTSMKAELEVIRESNEEKIRGYHIYFERKCLVKSFDFNQTQI